MNLKTIFLFFALFWLCCSPAFGQGVLHDDVYSEDSEDDFLFFEDYEEIVVITAAKKEQKIADAPATIISISADQIEKYGWRDLKDVFRTLVGIDVSYDTQGEVRTLVIMRGLLGNQKILILQDGQRQSTITGERIVYGHNMPLHFYQRIEIIYGPASALYGPEAYAGVVNLITKSGNDVNGLEAGAAYASTEAVISQVMFGQTFDEDSDFIIGGRLYHGNDYPLHEDYADYEAVNRYSGRLGEFEKDYPIKDWNVLFKLRYNNLTIGGDWQHELETNAPSTIPTNYAYIEDDLWGQDIRHLYARYVHEVNERTALTARVSVGDYSLNPATNFYVVQDIALTAAAPSYKYAYSGYLSANLQLDWMPREWLQMIGGILYEPVKSFPKTKNLDNGPFRFEGDLVDNMQDPPFDLVDPNGYVFGLVGLTNPIFGERNYYNLGGFIQAQINATNTLAITTGGRLDYNSIYDETINPRLGIVYRPSSQLSLKAMYGTAYIQPSNYYRWENFANPFIIHVPNEHIKPEKMRTISLSATTYLSRNWSLRGEIFRNDLQDIIRPVIISSAVQNGYPFYNPYRTVIGLEPAVDWAETNDNQGEVYTQGIELDLRYQFDRFGINLSYSYLDGEDKLQNHPVAKVSPHKINANLDYTGDHFTAAVSLRYYSEVGTEKSNTVYGDPGDQSYEFAGAFITYANLRYRTQDRLSFHLTVDNLFNTKHYGAAPYAESGWVQHRAPQALRKFFAGMTVKL